MNHQILEARKLISTMQPSTIEAYRVSSGVHIPTHITEHENRIKRYKWLTILASVLILVTCVIADFLIPSDTKGRPLLFLIGIPLAATIFGTAFIVEGGTVSVSLYDFITAANRVLPLTKVDTSSDPFEERVQQKLRECKKSFETAKFEYERVVREKGNFSTEAILTIGMKRSAASDLVNAATHANYFGLRYED